MNLTKEIKLTKKLIVFLILLNVIVIGISYSYALFEVSVVKNNIVKLQTVNIIMTLTSTDLENNKTLTLSGNETKEITLTITNESIINALARLYYIGEADLTFTSDTNFKDEENIGIGEINKGESKNITIEITNNSASSVTIELGAQEGLIGYELELNEGRNSIVLEEIVLPLITDIITAKLGTDGLVAINTDGELYSGTGEIREYRYSGLDVNNYVYFNCQDNDETETYDYGNENYDYANNCEIWRIVGVFTEDGEQVVKIMRNTMLTSEELPASYVVDGITYTIENGTTGYAYWNSTKAGTNYNDWTTAGLQYFLNTENDDNGTPGYMSILTTNAEELIRTTTYNLGNVSYETDMVITSYNSERGTTICASSVTGDSHNSSCNIWYGNQPTWSGKVALLYPSDYGYSASNTYWTTTINDYSEMAASTSWMQSEANHTTSEWFLSPASNFSDVVVYWYSTGYVSDTGDPIYHSYIKLGARPCLYLTSSAKILKGTGESGSPYVITG